MPRPFQFSLKVLLAITALAALAAWAMTAEPTPYSGAVMWFLVAGFPSAALAVVIEGDGFARRFCIGALVPACMPTLFYGLLIAQSLSVPEGVHPNDYGRRFIIIFWTTALIMGLVIGVASSLLQRSSKVPPD
jgi:hypothetical protein